MLKVFYVTIVIFIFFFLIYPLIGKSTASLLLVNMSNRPDLPRNFRICHQKLSSSINSNHLADLNASASAQFCPASLSKILSVLPTNKVTLIDLREESHGFINGDAVSWYGTRGWSNRGKTLAQIEHDQLEKLSIHGKKSFLIAYKQKTYPILLFPRQVFSEKELASSLNIGYLRLPVTDHCRPTDEIIDQFVAFTRTLPPDTWLHFHCSAGQGRTTTFLVMYDIIKNATKVSLEHIIERHEALGGINLFSLPSDHFWKHEHAEQRAQFIRMFYEYCKGCYHFETPWSVWFEKRWHDVNE
ncbi:hypothetical protein [Parachlamydia sp. AcF125]|uniref:phosphatase domain-containing putative toxin n=1 Tax=Parachlamydia sp. AcF125 TaxID=2795736 RepID=UPI001BC900F9|nr:hypothetical protein [Parachlamydia sp. AcF125]MBS4167597.1 Effector protein hopD2 [Parachlamydia sp. AcF125]